MNWYLDTLEMLREQVSQLEKENKALRDLVEFQAVNHQEEIWNRVTKAYLGGQRGIDRMWREKLANFREELEYLYEREWNSAPDDRMADGSPFILRTVLKIMEKYYDNKRTS